MTSWGYKFGTITSDDDLGLDFIKTTGFLLIFACELLAIVSNSKRFP